MASRFDLFGDDFDTAAAWAGSEVPADPFAGQGERPSIDLSDEGPPPSYAGPEAQDLFLEQGALWDIVGAETALHEVYEAEAAAEAGGLSAEDQAVLAEMHAQRAEMQMMQIETWAHHNACANAAYMGTGGASTMSYMELQIDYY